MNPEPSPTPTVRNDWNVVQDHTRVFESFVFVYPVISRRSQGLSLGVNLNPDKRCNFDCVYCEVDRHSPPRARHVNLDQLRSELTALIRIATSGQLASHPRFREASALTRRIRDIAFSGDGEPTMIANFSACVAAVIDIKRAERLDDTRIVLITNAAGLDKSDVQAGLALLDVNQGDIWAKLDAGTAAYYRTVNRSNVAFDRIQKNLLLTAQARPIVIQSLFLNIHGVPIPPAELDAYCACLNRLVHNGARIRHVQAYTIARPTPEPWATPLDPTQLETIANVIRTQTGLAVYTYR